MAVKKADEYQHNNPNNAFVDNEFVRGAPRAVANRTALYALAQKADQLKQDVTVVRVKSENADLLLVDATNIGNANGWQVKQSGGGSGGGGLTNVTPGFTEINITQDGAQFIAFADATTIGGVDVEVFEPNVSTDYRRSLAGLYTIGTGGFNFPAEANLLQGSKLFYQPVVESTGGTGGTGDVTKAYVDAQDANLQGQIDTVESDLTDAENELVEHDTRLDILESGGRWRGSYYELADATFYDSEGDDLPNAVLVWGKGDNTYVNTQLFVCIVGFTETFADYNDTGATNPTINTTNWRLVIESFRPVDLNPTTQNPATVRSGQYYLHKDVLYYSPTTTTITSLEGSDRTKFAVVAGVAYRGALTAGNVFFIPKDIFFCAENGNLYRATGAGNITYNPDPTASGNGINALVSSGKLVPYTGVAMQDWVNARLQSAGSGGDVTKAYVDAQDAELRADINQLESDLVDAENELVDHDTRLDELEAVNLGGRYRGDYDVIGGIFAKTGATQIEWKAGDVVSDYSKFYKASGDFIQTKAQYESGVFEPYTTPAKWDVIIANLFAYSIPRTGVTNRKLQYSDFIRYRHNLYAVDAEITLTNMETQRTRFTHVAGFPFRGTLPVGSFKVLAEDVFFCQEDGNQYISRAQGDITYGPGGYTISGLVAANLMELYTDISTQDWVNARLSGQGITDALKTSVAALSYDTTNGSPTLGEASGTMPAGSVAGLRFKRGAWIYQYITGNAGTLTWVRSPVG